MKDLERMRTAAPGLLLLALLALAGSACHKGIPGAWQVELVTNPSPPRAGAVTRMRLLLTTGAGGPVDGAAAYLELSPPAATAAPARVSLAPRGNGIYAGQFTFPAAGEWTVTLTVSRQGQTQIHQYHYRVAAGGATGL